MGAAVLLAYIPRLPSAGAPTGLGLTSGTIRITPGTNRRLRTFATLQIAFSFVLLAGAATLLSTLVALQTAHTGFNTRQVLAIDLPTPSIAIANAQEMGFYQEVIARTSRLPGVQGVALGSVTPWRDGGRFPAARFAAEGYTPADGEENPRARLRVVSPRFFAVLGVPLIAGRDFTDGDRAGVEPVAIVSESLARRIFSNGDAVNRKLWWTETFLGKPQPRRIVGIVADVDDENVVPGPAMTVYHPVQQMRVAGRLFVHASDDPYALVPTVTRVIREMSASQPVERAATLDDVRTEVLAPDRLEAFVVAGFAAVALLIAAVGVAGVLAFSVSARMREFGIRMAVGSSPRHLLGRVLLEGVTMVALGVLAGAAGGYAFAGVAAQYLDAVQLPSALPLSAAAAVLIGAAVLASLMPAARAARVDVLHALRSE
jgi:putative ABC transport system permease protein